MGPKNLFAIISIAQTIRNKEKAIDSVKEITLTAQNLMEKYRVLKSYLIDTMTSFNSLRKFKKLFKVHMVRLD